MLTVDFWIGELLVDLDPNLDKCIHPVNCPQYMQSIALVLTDAKIQDIVTQNNWKNLTNRMVYHSYVSSLPASKVESESSCSLSLVWARIANITLTNEMHEILFLLIHKKLPVQERLFRINMVQHPYCNYCVENFQTNMICDYKHYFCDCPVVSEAWSNIQELIVNLLRDNVTHQNILLLSFPKTAYENEVMWLVGSYFLFIWTSLQSDGASSVDKKKLFGFLKYKFKESQLGARIHLCLPSNVFG